MKRYLIGRTAMLSALAFASHSFAQASGAPQPSTTGATSDAPVLNEVVVTAQRRDERLQSVPIAVTAVSQAELSRAQIQNTQDLAVVAPGLTFPSSEGYALPHIRGVGNTAVAPGAENSVALYVDGVYFATPAGSILALNNVSSVEVLKGPQGTLFGRNATGGLIQVITRNPSQTPEAEGHVSYGNYNTVSADFYATAGLTSTLAGDIALQATHQGNGWGKNLATGEDVYKLDSDISVRSKLRWTPTDDTDAVLAVDFETTRTSRNTLAQALGTAATNPFYPASVITTRPYDINVDLPPTARLKAGGASLRVTHDLGFADLINIVAYRSESYYLNIDFDLGPAPIQPDTLNQVDHQFSEELQLQSHNTGRLRWTTGLYYFHARDSYTPQIIGFGPFIAPMVAPGLSLTQLNLDATQSTNSIAAYGQATYEIAPSWRLTGGFRETHETRKFNADEVATLNNIITFPFLSGLHEEFSVNKPTGRVSIDHDFAENIMGYVSYNHGFKSGGFNPGSPTTAPYQTETLNAYEVGLKTQLLDRQLRINTAGFYYNYANIQVAEFINGAPVIYNGAGAKLYGVDVDFEAAVTGDLSVSGGFEALHSEFTSFPCADHFAGGPQVSSPACGTGAIPGLPYLRSASGNRLPISPNFTSTVTVDYHRPLWGGKGDLAVTDAYTSKFFWEPNNEQSQPAYNLVNLTATWTAPNDHYSLQLWAKNITDKRYSIEIASAPTGVGQTFAAPRTFGVTAGFKY